MDAQWGPFVDQQSTGKEIILTFRSLADGGFETAIQAIARLSDIESVRIVNETMVDRNDREIFDAFKNCSSLKSLIASHRGDEIKLINRD